MGLEWKTPSDDRTVCGMSSAFVQVTVVPAATVIGVGEKAKLSMRTAAPGPAALATPRVARASTPARAARRVRGMARGLLLVRLGSGEGLVDDRQRLVASHEA